MLPQAEMRRVPQRLTSFLLRTSQICIYFLKNLHFHPQSQALTDADIKSHHLRLNISDFTELPLEPQKTLHNLLFYFFYICSGSPQDLQTDFDF